MVRISDLRQKVIQSIEMHGLKKSTMLSFFHYGGRIRDLVEAAGCKLVYLPAYSPDLNRTEKCWAWLKARIRKLLRNSDNLRDAIESVLAASAS